LDFDCYFGVVAHWFVAQAIAGYPITVYGESQHLKPFIALEDTVEGLARLAVMDPDERPDDHVVYNQVTRAISIVEMGTTIAEVANEFGYGTAVEHFENPRDEDETHKMDIENDRYAALIENQSVNFEGGIRESFETLVEFGDRIAAYEDRFLPGVLEDRIDTDEQ
jgi:nucleoside-diphosphate-sugar epimerase